MRLPAKPYQNAIASAVQTMADRKNSFGRGKNETNIVCIQSQVRRFPVPLSDSAHPGSARSKGGQSEACPTIPVITLSTLRAPLLTLKIRHWAKCRDVRYTAAIGGKAEVTRTL